MALVLDTVDITTAGDDGGTKFLLTGTFEPNVDLSVHVGPLGNGLDPKALSGLPGREVRSTGATAKAYLPVLEPGTYSIYVTDGTDNDVLADVITIVRSNYKSGVYKLRSTFSPIWAVGPRNVGIEP